MERYRSKRLPTSLNFALLAAAQGDWWQQEWLPKPSPTTIAVLLGVVAALLGTLIAVDIITTRRHRATVRKRSREMFDSITQAHGLNEEEITLLERFTTYQPEGNPLAVVNSPAEYDACVERELSALAARSAGEKAVEETLNMISLIRRKLALDHLPQGQFLHSTRALLPNQEIKINTPVEGVEKEFDSVVVAVTEKEITITAPRLGGEVYHLEPGMECGVTLVRQSDAIYEFKTRVRRTFLGRAPLLTISHTNDLKRVQLRRYYRVDVDIPLSFALLDKKEIERGGDEPEEALAAATIGARERDSGRLRNISGGGALVESGTDISDGDFLNFDIDIWSGRPENLTGEVVSVEAPPSAETEETPRRHKKTTAHLAFVGISEKVRDKVVRYVYRRQLDGIREAREAAEQHPKHG